MMIRKPIDFARLDDGVRLAIAAMPATLTTKPNCSQSMKRPVFSMAKPEVNETMVSGIASASISTPVVRGPFAATIWKYNGTKYAIELKISASKAQTASADRFDRSRKMRRGIMGEPPRVSSYHCVSGKRRYARPPRISNTMTIGSFQDLVPPVCNPTRNRMVAARMVKVPSQSILYMPVRNGVRGLCRCRVKYSRMIEKDTIGRLT